MVKYCFLDKARVCDSNCLAYWPDWDCQLLGVGSRLISVLSTLSPPPKTQTKYPESAPTPKVNV